MAYIYVAILAILAQVCMNYVSGKIDYSYSKSYKIMAILLNITVWVLLFHRFEWRLTFFVLAIAGTVLITSSFIDLKYQEIPNSYNVAVALLGGVFIYLYKDFSQELFLGGAIAFIVFFLIMALTGAMGGGDVKMAGGIGLFMGAGFVTQFIMYSFLSGAIIALILMIFKRKRKNDVFPFGPCIAMSALIHFIYYI